VAGAVAAAGIEVRIVELRGLPPKGDAYDYIEGGGSWSNTSKPRTPHPWRTQIIRTGPEKTKKTARARLPRPHLR
jgi:hypothetical protein